MIAVAARRTASAAAILSACACSAADGVEGPPANMEKLSADPIARANLQTRYIEGLRISADLPQHPTMQPVPAEEWRLIQRAGIDQIDETCNNYLYTLYRFNAQQKAARQGLLAATATTGVIMGLAGATTMAIGITAAALGLSASLFDASTNSVLFAVEASAVRNVVQESRSRYVAAMAARPPTTRPDMMIALRGYLSLCTPSVIEANINNSANGSRNSVTTPNETAGIAAAAMAAPAMALARPSISVLPDPIVPLPRVPPPIRNADGEIPPLPAEVLAIQQTLCVPPGSVGAPGSNSPTRVAVRQFLAARTGGDPDTKSDRLGPGSVGSLLRQAVSDASSGNAVVPCAVRAYETAFEVGLFGQVRAADMPEFIRFVETKVNAKLADSQQRIAPDGDMKTLRILVGKLRQQFDPNDRATSIDHAFYKKIS